MKKVEPIFYGRTFDDFLFRPQYSPVDSRKNVKLASRVCRGISINVPIVGANMDTITRERMAKTLALEGGVGVLDRSPSISDEAEMVRYVKRQHSHIIEDPLVVPMDFTVGKAKEITKRRGVSSVLVEETGDSGILIGILTHRDILAVGDSSSALISDCMTSVEKLIWAEPGISLEDAEKLMMKKRVEKLPLINKQRKICGLMTLRDIRLAKQKPHSVKDSRGRLVVGAAIGATNDYLERAGALIAADVDFVVMDVAHAHSAVAWKAVSEFRAKFGDFPLVCGNVATYEGAKFLAEMGVDGIKVGIGPGKGCLTRLETGAGVPQLQAIREAYLACEGRVPIIADGGIGRGYHISLALLAGADTVMLGSMFAGTDETPGEKISKNGKWYKYYRGMTSPQAVLENAEDDEMVLEALSTPAEGQQTEVECIGSVVDVIARISGHLRSAVSYAGEKSLVEARRKFSKCPELFIQLSEAAKRESFVR